MNKKANEKILNKYNNKKCKKLFDKKTAFSSKKTQKITFEDMTTFVLADTGKRLS